MEYTPRAGRRRRRQRRLRRLPHPHRDHRAGRHDRGGPRDRLPRPRDPQTCAGSSSTRTSTYDAEALDRAVVAKDQIRTVIRTFKERLFTEIFPGRSEVPKTLIFAKDDAHADDIVQIVREEFGKGNDFAVKITYKSTGQQARGADRRVPQHLQPADRGDRGHDRDRHRREAAGVRVLHARREEPHLLRADEGPRRARHQPGRPPSRSPPTRRPRTTS